MNTVLKIKAAGSARDAVTAETDLVAVEVADAEAEDEGPMLLLDEIGVVKVLVFEKLELPTELSGVSEGTGEDKLGEETADVTLEAEAEVRREAELVVVDSDLAADDETEEVAVLLPTNIVEAMVFDGALATEEGTERVDVSLATGAPNDPDIPSKVKNVEYWV